MDTLYTLRSWGIRQKHIDTVCRLRIMGGQQSPTRKSVLVFTKEIICVIITKAESTQWQLHFSVRHISIAHSASIHACSATKFRSYITVALSTNLFRLMLLEPAK